MNRERVQESIERVKAGSGNDSAYAVAAAFMGDRQWSVADYRDALIELLETVRDSVPLPKDADGEALRIGDSVNYKDGKGGVICVRYIHLGTDYDGQPSGPVWMIGVGRGEDYWAATPSALVHHHNPTVEALLREFWADVQEGDDLSGHVDKYAEKIRELLKEES